MFLSLLLYRCTHAWEAMRTLVDWDRILWRHFQSLSVLRLKLVVLVLIWSICPLGNEEKLLYWKSCPLSSHRTICALYHVVLPFPSRFHFRKNLICKIYSSSGLCTTSQHFIFSLTLLFLCQLPPAIRCCRFLLMSPSCQFIIILSLFEYVRCEQGWCFFYPLWVPSLRVLMANRYFKRFFSFISMWSYVISSFQRGLDRFLLQEIK